MDRTPNDPNLFKINAEPPQGALARIREEPADKLAGAVAMTDALLSVPDQKEGLSLVYVKALAMRAGYSTSTPTPDRDSVDLRIHAGGVSRPALDLQLKATAHLGESRDGFLPFRLGIKNYDDLRGPTQTPRVLVVFELPQDESQWMTVTAEQLVLRRCAYWLSLQQGHADVTGQETVTVHIPDRNLFDVQTLRTLMDRSRRGEMI